ncbi:MAG TPA: class I SAM-dependent methyltransferase [Anaerolineales bacterium]|nr:class I SAM-dependent methyltransferase [Anaerolineales bacterium]
MTYDLLSRFYDLENADFTEDLDFWVRLAKECGGPVLELGCGTGRVTQQIARAGINVVGLDYSEEMLVLARAKLNRRPELAARATLIYGDMQNFDIDVSRLSFASTADSSRLQTAPTSLHLIIVPFNTFMHLLTTADQLAMLACARKHLGPGGRLVLDMTNPAPAYADSPHETLTLERTFTDDVYHLTLQQFSTLRIDRVDQIAHIVYHYDATAADGSLKRTLVPLTLRYTFPAEMKLLLERSGFKLVHMYGDYAGSPLDDESERMIVVAEAV